MPVTISIVSKEHHEVIGTATLHGLERGAPHWLVAPGTPLALAYSLVFDGVNTEPLLAGTEGIALAEDPAAALLKLRAARG